MAAGDSPIKMIRELFYLFAFLTLLAGCFSRGSAMTADTYSMIPLGTSVHDVTAEVGKPYAVHSKGNGIIEYEYIERIRNNKSLISENHYFLIVEGGKVVGKRMAQEKQKDFDLIYEDDPNWDSYNAFPGSGF